MCINVVNEAENKPKAKLFVSSYSAFKVNQRKLLKVSIRLWMLGLVIAEMLCWKIILLFLSPRLFLSHLASTDLMSFDDLSSTSEKLSHLTTNRPKMTGRRLPTQFGGGQLVRMCSSANNPPLPLSWHWPFFFGCLLWGAVSLTLIILTISC